MYIYIYIVYTVYIVRELILHVCPLTKKWSVYNFNDRFILTVRDRITTTKIQKNTFQLPGVFYTGKELRLGALS